MTGHLSTIYSFVVAHSRQHLSTIISTRIPDVNIEDVSGELDFV